MEPSSGMGASARGSRSLGLPERRRSHPQVEGRGIDRSHARTVWDPRSTIAAKRDGRALPEDEIERFVLAYARGEIDDGPAAAFLMACLLNGLDGAETLAMTRAMIASGDRVTFGDLGHPS